MADVVSKWMLPDSCGVVELTFDEAKILVIVHCTAVCIVADRLDYARVEMVVGNDGSISLASDEALKPTVG